jgi:glutamate-1-semialdehyde aminotransferase
MDHGVDLGRVLELKRREDSWFASTHPRSLELRARARRTMPLGVPLSWMSFLYDHPPLFVDAAEGAHFTDVDGHRYLDMSLGITVASTGHTAEPIVRAVAERMTKGIQFHLPTEDAAIVSEELARRWGLPKWQYQLSATQANTDALEVWTEETHLRMQGLARALAEGMESVIRLHGRNWDVYHLGNRAGYRFAPTPPRNSQEAGEFDLPPVRHLQRVFMANRGVWDFGWWGGQADLECCGSYSVPSASATRGFGVLA